MQKTSRTHARVVTGLLVLLMLLTRVGGHGDPLHLPDASMAVFFLGGLLVRRHLVFLGFVALAVAIDWAAIRYAGVSAFCVTGAYAFLPLAYAVLWYGGRKCARQGLSPLVVFAAGGGCAVVSFLISNGSFYWFGGRIAQPNVADYAAGAWQWGPHFVATTLAYIGAGLLVRTVWTYLRSLRIAHGGA